MWRLLLRSVIVLAGVSGPALANETPRKPQAVSSASWAGFYVGVHAGYAWGTADINTTVGPPIACGGGPANCIAIDAVESQPLHPNGFAGGVLAGHNFQSGRFVYGLEGDISGLTGSASRAQTQVFPIGGCCFTISQKVEADWMMTLRPRIGYAFDNALVYATGGLALARLRYIEQATDTAGDIENTDVRRVKTGYALGAGIEYALSGRWSVRGEYLYANFGRIQRRHDRVNQLCLADAAGLQPSRRFFLQHSACGSKLPVRPVTRPRRPILELSDVSFPLCAGIGCSTCHVRCGSIATLWPVTGYFRFSPEKDRPSLDQLLNFRE